MGRSRYRFGESHYPHFMTNTVVAWLPVFSSPKYADIVFDSWRYLQRERQIDLLGYVVMENHLHWVAVGPQLSRRVGEFKSFTATSIIKALRSAGRRLRLQELQYYKLRHKVDQHHQLWLEGSHPQQLDSVAVLRQKLEYIHNNPVRRGYVDDPLHWRYSSARCYAGGTGMVPVATDW